MKFSFSSKYDYTLTRIIRKDQQNRCILFFRKKVLHISSGIDDMGAVRWDLALVLLFAWIVVYCCICKGIKTSGRVRTFGTKAWE